MPKPGYDKELIAIIQLADLKLTDPTEVSPPYIVNVLAKHNATERIQVLVEARTNGGLNQFRQDFPNAGIMVGDGTPDNHDEWRMLAFSREVQGSTSPVEIFKRAHKKQLASARKAR